MLVLSRKKNESVMIACPDGSILEVLFVDFQGSSIRLGFAGPREIEVHRKEVWRAIQREKNNGAQ